jgi:hypothetical protein
MIKYINVPSLLLVTKQETRKTFTIAIAKKSCKKIKKKKDEH